MAMAIIGFISLYHVAEFFIGLVGVFGIALVLERFKALYFVYPIKTKEFMDQVLDLLSNDKREEAIALCATYKEKPLPYVIKRILERSDRDDESIRMSYDIGTSEVAPGIIRHLNHLPMISNVVTLIGLLGTVAGLIIAFDALSLADASQRNTVLTQGISLAMTATAAGLAVAIPVMFIYSFLYTRQTKLFSEIDNNALKVMEHLFDRGNGFDVDKVYPSRGSAPPPPKTKQSA
ncbi:MAG: MotA/TolQ/ExbB proton channel family protein [Pseudomonadota bacterium]|nr:MotA/TolQ/ExbB proton channel family protein [Pseudomonadota bacterium]